MITGNFTHFVTDLEALGLCPNLYFFLQQWPLVWLKDR